MKGLSASISSLQYGGPTDVVVEDDVFRLIIEWIYTGEFKVNDLSLSLLVQVFKAAETFKITLLSDFIVKSVENMSKLISQRNFGDIFQIANIIDSSELEKAVCERLFNERDYTENEDQLKKVSSY